jgi:hypothetical protein
VRWRDPIFAALTLAGVAGLALLYRSDRKGALLLAACLASYTPLFYLIHVNVRHRYPVDWILLAASCSLAVKALEALAGRFPVFNHPAARCAVER